MNEAKLTPKDFFLYFGSAVGLYVSAVSLLQLLFQVINYAFPDNLDYYVDPYSSGARWGIAMLIIFFPLYLWLSWTLNRGSITNPEKRGLWIRKWLSYLTLFIAGISMAIDLVVLVNSFLGGEITNRFFLKVAAVFFVAGIIFWYYLYDLRWDVGQQGGSFKAFAAAAIVLVVLSLVAGFLAMGSPATARKVRFDDRRVNDLMSVQWQLVNYWQQKEALPESLELLADPISGFILPRDPLTDTVYEYRKTGKTSFTLCATFSLPTRDNGRSGYAKPMVGEGVNENWQHGEGRVCFERTIDQELYPPRGKQ